MTQTPIAELSFEAAMAELEQVVTKIERGEVALEESITLYERGAELKKHCEAKLKAAEEKVTALTLDRDGAVTGESSATGL